jgi:adenylate cyclase
MGTKSQHRLAAVIAADVAGYSRLMRLDEEATMAAWWSYRREVINPMVADHGGRVVKLTGDGFLAEFSSATDAVSAAISMQSEIAVRVAEQPDDKRVQFRMGVNLGDILWDDEDIYGDGVNIAARIEALAEPGGILVSSSVYDQVNHRVSAKFEDMGKHSLKNIDVPLRVYRVALEHIASQATYVATEPQQPPDKPSIAVLAFSNMSDDSEQEYFSDGISEDIITELARFNSLFVIARNSSFHYKGSSPKAQDVGRELGVQYVIEGSVRKSGNRVRITAQLVETHSGNHIWAQRYDRELTGIFEVQDEVTKAIVGIIPGRLDVAEAQRSARKVPGEVKAYDMYLRGLQIFTRSQDSGANREELQRAKELFREAIKLEPDYARAHTYVALTLFNEYFFRLYAGVDSLQDALKSVQMAITIDPNDNFAPAVRGLILIYLGRDDDGVTELTETLQLNSNNAELLYWAGFALSFAGRSSSAVTHVNEAIRLDPFNKYYYTGLGFALYLNGQFDDAVTAFRKIVRADWVYSNACLAAAYGQLGRNKEAQACAAQFVLNVPKEIREKGGSLIDSPVEIYDLAWRDYYPYSKWLDLILDGMRKADLS